jgi:competence protein ComEC
MQNSSFVSAIQNADILLAPHHGRESGYNTDFMSNVNPCLTIISDGKFCDTSANGRYSQKSQGWLVHRRRGSDITRKCLTTNSDGTVVAEFGYNHANSRFLSVTID